MTDSLSRAIEEGAKAAAEAAGFNWNACAQSQWRRDTRAGVAAFLRALEPTPGMVKTAADAIYGEKRDPHPPLDRLVGEGLRAGLTALVEEMEKTNV